MLAPFAKPSLFAAMLAVMASFLFILPDRAAAQSSTAEGPRIAIVVDRDDRAQMIAALEMAINHARLLMVEGRSGDIRVVAHNGGLRLLREDGSPAVERLKFAARSFPMISFHACVFTQNLVTRREGQAPSILSLAQNTPNALVTLEEMERTGWTIIRL